MKGGGGEVPSNNRNKKYKTYGGIAGLIFAFLILATGADASGRYIPVFYNPEMGRYFLDTETIEKQDGIFFFQYKNIVSAQYRRQTLLSAGDKISPDERLKLKRWAYSIVSLYYDPVNKTAKPIVSSAYSKTDDRLARRVYDEPFAPAGRSPAVNAVCSALMQYVAAHPGTVKN